MCTLNPALNQSGTPFGPDGCQVPIGNGICGETRTLDIVHEFKRLYEEKLQEIDASGGGDCLQEKVRLQQEWIGDLTCQNEMLVRAVEDLEREAAERVHMLEQKLQSSAKCLNEMIKKYREYDFTNEILEVPLRKMFHLENDQQNLLEFIRRARENNRWDLNGLKFFHIDPDKDLMKIQPNVGRIPFSNTTTEANGKLAAQESKIKELHTSLDHLKSFGDIPRIARDLGKKIQECEVLQKRMEEMQKTLDEEDTFKNNHLTQLKEDCKMLEEKVIHADEQIAFRDSIINDLRKEIKLLQEEMSLPERSQKHSSQTELESRKGSYEPYVVINHTRKIVQSGKSTVIYLKREDGDDKSKTKKTAEHTSCCTKCRQKLEKKLKTDEQPNALHLCKSENDLCDFRKVLRPVKERSKLTSTGLGRCNTFVGCTSEVLKRTDFGDRVRDRNVAVPNHIPVRTYVDNIEVHKMKNSADRIVFSDK